MTNLHDNTAAAEAATPATPSERSLRYWLRAADAVISRDTAERFAAEGATRRDLRILSMISGATEVPERLRERLERGGKRIFALADRGWIEHVDGAWQLTDAGTAAHERLAALTQQTRDRTAGAVSPEDLSTTLATLETIAREFGWTEDTRLPRRGYGHQRGLGAGHDRCGDHRQDRGYGYGHGHGRGRGRGSERGQGENRGRGHNCGHDHSHDHGHDHTHDRGHGNHYGQNRHHNHNNHHNQDRGYGHGYGRGGARGGGRTASFERGFAAGFTAARGQAGPR